MLECDPIDAMTTAERACRDALARMIAGPVYRFDSQGEPDCAVFNIGYSYQGDLHLCRAGSYHFRAHLDIYRRNHDELQRELMRLMRALPISPDLSADDDLRNDSNVLTFRIAPEAQAVGEITAMEVTPKRGGAPVATYVATVQFDVVFAAAF